MNAACVSGPYDDDDDEDNAAYIDPSAMHTTITQHPYLIFAYVYVLRIKCASVFNTHSSKLHKSSSSNSKNAYFSVSASQKLSMLSVGSGCVFVTSSMAA